MPRTGIHQLAIAGLIACNSAPTPTTSGIVAADKAGTEEAPPPSPSTTAEPSTPKTSLVDARRGFQTKLLQRDSIAELPPDPPPDVFRKVRYPSAVGELSAYVSVPPKDGKRHPAIVWITGGDCNSIGDVWSPASRANDQTGKVFRDAGIVMMFPSLRGGNDNPGVKEMFFGEVDDVIAAGEYVRGLDYVDPTRVYLGGHSTGGTLVLLVAESTDRFRAVFSFGPVADVRGYGPEIWPHGEQDSKEAELRSPRYWLDAIRVPTYVFEGADGGNVDAAQLLGESSSNPRLNVIGIAGTDHFSVLAPINEVIAKELVADVGDIDALEITDAELAAAFPGG
jgi:acetyl esterase/lipase